MLHIGADYLSDKMIALIYISDEDTVETANTVEEHLDNDSLSLSDKALSDKIKSKIFGSGDKNGENKTE